MNEARTLSYPFSARQLQHASLELKQPVSLIVNLRPTVEWFKGLHTWLADRYNANAGQRLLFHNPHRRPQERHGTADRRRSGCISGRILGTRLDPCLFGPMLGPMLGSIYHLCAVHRLSSASQFLPRDKRRSTCGWRAGGGISNARFCATYVWPPFGMSNRICNKCFPSKHPVASALETDGDAIEVDE